MEAKKVVITVAVCFFIILLMLLPGYLRLRKMQESITHLSEENIRIKEQNRKLQEDIDKFKNDPSYRIGVAKEELKILDKNEVIYKMEKKN